MKSIVVKTILLFPKEIREKITKNVWFVSSFEDGWAFTLRGDELTKREHLIFLSDDLLNQDERQITFTTAHEIGHVILGHRNSILESQTKGEIKKQEKEADEFAKKYLSI